MKKTIVLILSTTLLALYITACNVYTQSVSNDNASGEPVYLTASTKVDSPLVGGVTNNVHSGLSVPTQIIKIDADYFLVDCYHNQILTSTNPDAPLTEWYVFTDQINRGHTIAGDGKVYLADDTENNRVLVFEKRDDKFLLTQTFENIGIRPHYVVYDEASSRFYASSSQTGELYVFYRDTNSTDVYLEKILTVPELNGVYTRSFTIIEDDIYFVACNGSILRTDKNDLDVLERWAVPAEIAGMVQLTKIEDCFYITVSTDLYGDADFATILRVPELDMLNEYMHEDLSDIFYGDGTPYYITCFDDAYYLTQHCMQPGTGVWKFNVAGEDIVDVEVLQP